MKRFSPFMFIVVIAALFPSAPSVAQGGGAFPQPSETLPGFKAHGVYETKGIENLSLFNGDPQLAVPLGPEYPLSYGLTFRLTAHYSSRFWHMFQTQCGVNGNGEPMFKNRAHVRGLPTLGVGWTLELGTIDPAPNPNAKARYFAPDGGVHEFWEPGLSTLGAPEDESPFRIQRVPAGGYVVRFADGSSHWLTQYYERPDPTDAWGNGFDFTDVDSLGYRRTERWGLKQIRDRNNVVVAEVTWDTEKTWQFLSISLPDSDRKIEFTWKQVQLNSIDWDVIDYIRFPVISGPTPYLTATMAYHGTGLFQRTRFHDPYWESACEAVAPYPTYLPFLTSISQGSEVYGFSYSLGDTGTGALTSFRLPTGTLVEYAYSDSTASMPCLFGEISTCMSLDDEAPSAAESPDVDIENRLSKLQSYISRSPAVISRTETDPTNGLSATTTYHRKQFAQPVGTEPPEDFYRDPTRVLRRVNVYRPSGNGGMLPKFSSSWRNAQVAG